MRRILIAALAVLAVAFGVAQPAAASTTAAPHPADISGTRFWSPSICVQPLPNTTGYPIGQMAQAWNVVTGPTLQLDLSYNCAGEGYPPSRRMYVGVYSDPDGYCLKVVNGGKAYANGMYRWTDGPQFLINYGSTCTETAARRQHMVSNAIGVGLGMKTLNSAGWNSRVMNNTTYSFDNVLSPTYTEGHRVWELYTGVYGG